MDEQVLAAMRKWPDVPAVYGWLRLGRRGGWFLIDRGAPGFDPIRDGDGSLITSPPILDFIARNYDHDETGAWYWQNGPQRVFVDLELAPLVLRVMNTAPDQRLITQTGHPITTIHRVASDADGNCFMLTDRGPAVIDDRDIGQLVIEPADADSAAAASDGSSHGAADASGGFTQDRWMIDLARYPGPLRLADGRAVWPIEPLTITGAAGAGQAFGFQHRPRGATDAR